MVLPYAITTMVVRAMLSGWSGTLVTDDYGRYKALFRSEDGDAPVAEALVYTGCPYEPEGVIRYRPAEQKQRWRRRYARPLL